MAFKSGNKFGKGGPRPGSGRPRDGTGVEVRLKAQEYTHEALERLAFWMRSENSKASVAAAVALLDRGHGKSPQALDVTVLKTQAEVDAENKRFDRLYGYLGEVCKAVSK